ncbi:MAG: response regulator transcription factor [Acidimicrobiia bacterium]|nr:response regulator transcription factor [Acidimicrobiia bacterium]
MRVIVVDDHKMIRDGIRWMLMNEPTIEIVGEAADGEAALDVVGEMLPDVVLMDVRMPGTSGLDALVSIKQRWPNMAVLMLTMYDETNLVASAIGRGASGYLLKSAGRDEMIRAIRRVGAGGSFLQGQLAESFVRHLSDHAGQKGPLELSRGDRRILELVAGGMGNREIASKLAIPEAEVKAGLQRAFKALHATGRSEAVAIAFRMGVIS